MWQCCARAEDSEKDMCQDNCEIWLNPTDPHVLMVGLLAQPEEGLVGPDDVAELHFWSSWRLLANASSPWVIGREHESNNKNLVQILRQTTPNNQDNEDNAARLTAKKHKKPHRRDRLKRGMDETTRLTVGNRQAFVHQSSTRHWTTTAQLHAKTKLNKGRVLP